MFITNILKISKAIGYELILFLTFFIVLNNYVGRVEQTISGDGQGYYDYLPAHFIHNDLLRVDWETRLDSSQYQRINTKGCYIKYGDKKVNKYTVGTALLQSPFFMINYWLEGKKNIENDGYQDSYHHAVFVATICYLFCSVFILRFILLSYNIENWIIKFLQLLLLFATGVLHYSNYDASYSHVYSLFVISLFIWMSRLFFIKRKMRYFVIAFGLIGFVIILRQVNFLIIFFLPFLADSWYVFVRGIMQVLKEYKKLILGFLVMFFFLLIQGYVWYIQTGNWIVYSYQGEVFNWGEPEILNVLFSYRKGLFVYTPVLFISLFGMARLFFKKLYYQAFTWFFFFSLITYVFSSWWCWFYGACFGMRPYVDFYVVFFILFAMLLSKCKWYFQVFIVVFSLLAIPVNIIQTYQYKHYILDWGDMNEIKYWRVFLRTDELVEGWNWKRKYNFDWCVEEEKIKVGNLSLDKKKASKLFQINTEEINTFNKVFLIQVQFNSNFPESEKAEIIFGINDTVRKENKYWHSVPYIQYAEGFLNQEQRGLYNYEYTPLDSSEGVVITLEAITGENSITLEDVTVVFYSKL